MIEKYLTTEQVANILQVHPLTILKFIKQGKLKGVKIGRVYRIQENDVKQFLDDRKMTHEKKDYTHPETKVRKEQIIDVEVKTSRKEHKGGEGNYYII
ncbi:MAG: helix-turn-helix domain-containing protein [Candidatus Gracilibacteria bacterium]|jgi:excisionase family DNA binding protein